MHSLIALVVVALVMTAGIASAQEWIVSSSARGTASASIFLDSRKCRRRRTGLSSATHCPPASSALSAAETIRDDGCRLQRYRGDGQGARQDLCNGRRAVPGLDEHRRGLLETGFRWGHRPCGVDVSTAQRDVDPHELELERSGGRAIAPVQQQRRQVTVVRAHRPAHEQAVYPGGHRAGRRSPAGIVSAVDGVVDKDGTSIRYQSVYNNRFPRLPGFRPTPVSTLPSPAPPAPGSIAANNSRQSSLCLPAPGVYRR